MVSEQAKKIWAWGIYDEETALRSLMAVAEMMQQVFRRVRGDRMVVAPDSWLEEAMQAMVEEARLSLQMWPKGVGLRIPGDNNSLDCTLPGVQVYVTVNPLDTGERPYSPTTGACANIALQVGADLVMAVTINLESGALAWVRPGQQGILTSGSSRVHDPFTIIPPGKKAARAAGEPLGGRLLLQGEYERYEEFFSLLGGEFRSRLTFLPVFGQPSVFSLLEVIQGHAGGYVCLAHEETAPWLELPLMAFARAGGLKLYEIHSGHLEERSLEPEKYSVDDEDYVEDVDDNTRLGRPPVKSDGLIPRYHGLLYVSSAYTEDLVRHLCVQPLEG